MLKISQSRRYKTSLKKYKYDLNFLKELEFVIECLVKQKVLPERYHDHELKGKLTRIRECHIRPDDLLLYFVIEAEILKLVDVGSRQYI